MWSLGLQINVTKQVSLQTGTSLDWLYMWTHTHTHTHVQGEQSSGAVSLKNVNLGHHWLEELLVSVFFLATLHSLWDLSPLTRDQTCAPCSRRVES